MNFSTSPAIFRWKPAAWLRVTGEDAANFLQGQFTNELRGVPAGGAVYGLWLTLKGKVLADSFVVRGGAAAGGGAEEFWVGSYFSPAAVIKERLEAYVIADDVVIEDLTMEWAGVSAWGGSVEAGAGDVVFPGRRSREACVEWMFPGVRANDVSAALVGRVELDAEEMERRRIAAAVPAVPADIGPGDLPGEGGLESIAISYTKGCYLGQEVMARLKAMGQVRRRLVRVVGSGVLPETLPAGLFSGDKRVGEVRSAVRAGAEGWSGLAIISLMQAAGGGSYALAVATEPTVRLIDEL
jgi:folate-binding protein YgfZ